MSDRAEAIEAIQHAVQTEAEAEAICREGHRIVAKKTMAALRARRQAAGQCIQCGAPIQNHVRCLRCRARARQKKAA